MQPLSTNYTLRCSFDGNPVVSSVTWLHNGTVLNANSYISISTGSTYSQLIFSSLQGLNDSGGYTCSVSNGFTNASRLILNLIVQSKAERNYFNYYISFLSAKPDPVYDLVAPESDITNTSVRLTWSLGFNGYSSLTGGRVSYTAVNNGEGNGVQPFTGENITEQTVSNLQPFTGYNFSVIVMNDIGSSSSETIYVTTQSNGEIISFHYNISV